MAQFPDDYRSHTIFPHASGPTVGPWVGSYSAFRIEPNDAYRAVCQGTLPGVYQSPEEAHAAAVAEAKRSLDALLD